MPFLNQKAVCLGSQCLRLAKKDTSGHFEIANTHPPNPSMAIKQDIRYWGNCGVPQLPFLISVTNYPVLLIFKKRCVLFPTWASRKYILILNMLSLSFLIISPYGSFW